MNYSYYLNSTFSRFAPLSFILGTESNNSYRTYLDVKDYFKKTSIIPKSISRYSLITAFFVPTESKFYNISVKHDLFLKKTIINLYIHPKSDSVIEFYSIDFPYNFDFRTKIFDVDIYFDKLLKTLYSFFIEHYEQS